MLNIPDAIKALYMTEARPDIRRNFRVTFPNGEYSDVNADQIVRESVKLTESVMSQSSFRFGLAEAPMISFETVGVGNMLGMTIECWHEIETTSLTAAQIADIQAGTWDGELVLGASSDLGFDFYRIPLGTFFVDKCPRNHGAMTHRRVTAYGPDLGAATALSPFYDFVVKQLYSTDKWRLYPYFFYANLYNGDRNILSKFSNIQRSYYTRANAHPGAVSITLASGQAHTAVSFSVSASTAYLRDAIVDANAGMMLVRIKGARTAQEKIKSSIRSYLADNGISLAGASVGDKTFSSHEEGIEYVARKAIGRSYIAITVGVGETDYEIPPTSDYIQHVLADVPQGYWFGAGELFVRAATNLRATITGVSGTTQIVADGTPLIDSLEIYELTAPTGANMIPDFGLSTEGIEASGYYQFSQVLDYMSIVTGLVEMIAEFGTVGRDGAFKLVALDPSDPVEVLPSEYSECWYDEYEVAPIGSVNYRLVTGEEMIAEIGSGLSVYDMTGNAVIEMLASATEVETLLDDNFATGATALNFVPIELSARGLPWVEAGDAIRVITEDGETVDSYVLERTLSGVAFLTDSITATGGDLVSTEVVEY